MKSLLILTLLPVFCFGQDYKIQKSKHRLYIYDSSGNKGSVRIRPDRGAYKHFEVIVNGGYQSNSRPIGYSSSQYSSGSGVVYGASLGTFVVPAFSLGVDYSNQYWDFSRNRSTVNLFSGYARKHITFKKSEINVALKVGYVLWSRSEHGIDGTPSKIKYDVSGIFGGVELSYRYYFARRFFVSASIGANRALAKGNVLTSTASYVGTSPAYRIEYSLYSFPAAVGFGFRF